MGLLLLMATGAQSSSWAAQHFFCEVAALEALAFKGAVDGADIPNSNADTITTYQ